MKRGLVSSRAMQAEWAAGGVWNAPLVKRATTTTTKKASTAEKAKMRAANQHLVRGEYGKPRQRVLAVEHPVFVVDGAAVRQPPSIHPWLKVVLVAAVAEGALPLPRRCSYRPYLERSCREHPGESLERL
jgi:hypothetical protein